jgi:hypothetical protein
VPPRRRRELVARLLGYADRVLVGVYNEQRHERPTEELLRACGFEIAGRHDAAHPAKPAIDYRVVWIDS